MLRNNVFVVVGGCFATLWGDRAIGGPSGAEGWQLADRDPLDSSEAVGKWLLQHSQLPVGILRRLAPEPIVLRHIDHEQAEQLAARLCENLPPSLDGLGVDDFSAALQSTHGWPAVAAMVEHAWVKGHDCFSTMDGESADIAPSGVSSDPAVPQSSKRPKPVCLGERLGLESRRSPLVSKARGLGLRRAIHLENLARARGYYLLGESVGQPALPERVPCTKFSNLGLAVVLLSPLLEFSEKAICLEAVALRAQLMIEQPEDVRYYAYWVQGQKVVRHVALLGREVEPGFAGWDNLLMLLPSLAGDPALPPGIMPDEAIRLALTAARSKPPN